MAFKISLLSDVRGFLKGTDDVGKALDDVADSLDDLARDTKQNADEAGRQLERGFSDAFDKVRREGKDASRRMGDDLKDGAKEAGEGFNELGDEAKDSAKEAAASFSGEFSDVADYIQEVLAQALQGFGPVGAAAGIAAAAGVGILISSLQQAAEDAETAKQTVLDLADQLADVKGNPAALAWADLLRGKLQEIVNTKEWYEFWQDTPKTRLEEWGTAAKKYGVDMADVMRAQAGDAEALGRVTDQLNRQQADLNNQYLDSADIYGNYNEQLRSAASEVGAFRYQVTAGASDLEKATEWNKAYTEAMRDIPSATERAAEASATFTDSLNDHLTVADEGLDKFVHKGKLSLDEWASELRRRAKETKAVQDFTVNLTPKLSPEAAARFAELPFETQAKIADAFKSGGKKARQKIVQNLEAEAKVTKVDINTGDAQKYADSKPIEIPTTVANTGALKGAQEAADAAQKVADRTNNRIEYHTRIDTGELQRQVDRAAASIRPPTITIKTRVQKETP
ncbi:hypothetical protein [Micropruina sp.]|uniref:hypothetical protein n=1 Tax=Micropruina sp. TaxID=2737536 RepID=UPI0039E46BEC